MSAIEELKLRLAKGEISVEEFRAIQETLNEADLAVLKSEGKDMTPHPGSVSQEDPRTDLPDQATSDGNVTRLGMIFSVALVLIGAAALAIFYLLVPSPETRGLISLGAESHEIGLSGSFRNDSEQSGSVLFWVGDGEPGLLTCIFETEVDPFTTYNFGSLCPFPAEGQYSITVVWAQHRSDIDRPTTGANVTPVR